jgi:hypothetical protein
VATSTDILRNLNPSDAAHLEDKLKPSRISQHRDLDLVAVG